MLRAAFWGLIQGLSEFLPISSSGHLVLVPAVLGQDGPDLGTSAVLHLGTLLAVLVYFRKDLLNMLTLSRTEVASLVAARRTPVAAGASGVEPAPRMSLRDAVGLRMVMLIVLGTIPAAAIGLAFESFFDGINEEPRVVATALVLTGIGLMATRLIPDGSKSMEEGTMPDAGAVGMMQALALIPGVSRSGSTIAGGLLRGFDRVQAARYSFLLGIPAIAGGGLISFVRLFESDAGVSAATWVGMAVAAVSGYAAIAILLRLLGRVGLAPFGLYCIAAGSVAFFLV
jgi:undecaprenyl-diphosphatase